MYFLIVVIIVTGLTSSTRALICTRHPANTATAKSPVDENYVISITNNPKTYILGQEYNVSLNAFNGHRYISFMLALENENGDFNYLEDLGRFELNDFVETRFSPNCINMVENTNTNTKTHTHVTWVAPSEPGSGCILIRATLLQHRDVWHMDDGGLTYRICEEVVDDVESQPMATALDSPCCACDEARYELIFEATWSRNLHPKDFPARGWETRFCELVGASHSPDYRFWEYGALASEELREYAEHCTSRMLEREFSVNFREHKIRTIIKARGPAYPNLNSKAVASVRVDAAHHLLSFASKIEPSPDWIVGISGLELCLRNCTWLEEKVINLYPWDVGTDAGPSYTSPDQPQVPPDVIRRMRSDFPNDPRSPFYDENAAPMKPMAVLTVKRQRIYERRCADEESNNSYDVPRECVTHPWSSWSECSTKCGDGMQYRRRVYKQLEVAKVFNCEVPLYEERACQGESCGLGENMHDRNYGEYNEPGLNSFGSEAVEPFGRQQNRAECQLSIWSAWSPCSVTCGEGLQTRQRSYLNRNAESKCQAVTSFQLMETQRCVGKKCSGNLSNRMEEFDNNEDQLEESVHFEDTPTNVEENLPSLTLDNNRRTNDNWENSGNQRPAQRQPSFQQNRTPYMPDAMPGPRLNDVARVPWQRPQVDSNSFNREFGAINVDQAPNVDKRCFEGLQTNSARCYDPTVVGNFWFYNYCNDKCMLFAADACDRNVNKFTKLETCEDICHRDEFRDYLRQRQSSPECQMQRESEQRNQEQIYETRRRNLGYRQRG